MSHQPLDLAVRENNAVVLPDGRVLVIGGSGGRGGGPIEYNYQLFDPSTGTMSVVARTSVPRHDHSTAALLPDGSVLAMGGNRTELVPGDSDAGVPVGQLYRPAYFFRGPRPSLDDAPDAIRYGSTFDLEVTSSESVGAVPPAPVSGRPPAAPSRWPPRGRGARGCRAPPFCGVWRGGAFGGGAGSWGGPRGWPARWARHTFPATEGACTRAVRRQFSASV